MSKLKRNITMCVAAAMTILSMYGGGSEAASDQVPELKGPGNVTLSALGFNLDIDPNGDIAVEAIKEATGYDVKYTMLPSDGADEKLIMDVAGGADYDIMRLTVPQFNTLMAQGALMPLNDLLDTYGQDIMSGLADEGMWSPVSDDDGTIYGIPYMNEYPKQIGFIVCRKDLMEAAGITEIPQTLDEFYDCLTTLKDYYGDQYIILSAYDGWDYTCRDIAAAFGIYNDWMADEDGNVYYMTEHKNFKDYMDFMKKLYDEGILDSEYAVNTESTVTEKIVSGKAIMGPASHATLIPVSNNWIDNMGLTVDDIGYICPLEGEDGTCSYLAGAGMSSVTCILRNCKNAADAVNFMNLKVQNQEYICIGEEGVHFEFDEKGNYVPIQPAFANEKSNVWWYCNAMDTAAYEKQWLARVRKNEYQWNAFENTSIYTAENRPEIYKNNVFLYKPAIGAYTEENPAVRKILCNYMLQVAVGASDMDGGKDSFISDWTAADGEEVREDLQTWYTGYYQDK